MAQSTVCELDWPGYTKRPDFLNWCWEDWLQPTRDSSFMVQILDAICLVCFIASTFLYPYAIYCRYRSNLSKRWCFFVDLWTMTERTNGWSLFAAGDLVLSLKQKRTFTAILVTEAICFLFWITTADFSGPVPMPMRKLKTLLAWLPYPTSVVGTATWIMVILSPGTIYLISNKGWTNLATIFVLLWNSKLALSASFGYIHILERQVQTKNYKQMKDIEDGGLCRTEQAVFQGKTNETY